MPQGLWRPLYPAVGVRFQPMAGNRCGFSFIVNRPAKDEPGFRLERQEASGRNIRYTTRSYAADRPEGDALRWQMNGSAGPSAAAQDAGETPPIERIDLRREFAEVGIGEVLDQLDRELVGLKPVKTRIREIASLLLIERLRKRLGLTGGDADPAHVVHRQSRHRQDHRRAADGRASCTGWASCGAAMWCR